MTLKATATAARAPPVTATAAPRALQASRLVPGRMALITRRARKPPPTPTRAAAPQRVARARHRRRQTRPRGMVLDMPLRAGQPPAARARRRRRRTKPLVKARAMLRPLAERV